MIYLASHELDWPIPGKDIAEATGVPRKYLSKVLADLVRVKVLESARGKSGGFNLVRAADETFLYDILAPFESFEPRHCPFVNQECNDANPCQAHVEWHKVVDAEQRFLRQTTLHKITFAGRHKGGHRRGQSKQPTKKTAGRLKRTGSARA